jgi:hypothetical protein
MKKLLLLVTTFFIIAISCNKIDTSKELFNIISPVEISSWDPDYAATVIRKIYIEEFTGHTCIYCPAGARELKAIMEEDSTIIATAIHCSSLADPSGIFTFNYKTPMGNMICDDFSINGLPKATINRKIPFGADEWGIGQTKWRSAIADIDRSNVCAGIQLQCTADETKHEIDAKIDVTIIKEIKNPIQICLVLQQDSIISGQLDGSSSNIVYNYVHHHVLRAGFNGNYGTKLTPNGIVSAQNKYSTSFKLSYKEFLPYSNFPTVINHCSVVAYLLDIKTKEVLQVEYVHLH